MTSIQQRPAGGFVDLTPPPTWRDHAWQTAYRIGFPLARRWRSLRRPDHIGALIALSIGGKLLLLRSSYRLEWSFPGGGVEPGESPEQAAQRELLEEIGLETAISGPAQIVEGVWDGLRDRVHVFRLALDHPPSLRFDNREITGARLADPAELAHLRLTGPVRAYAALLPPDAPSRSHC